MTGFLIVYLGITPLLLLGTDLTVGADRSEKIRTTVTMFVTSTEFGVAVLGLVALRSGRLVG
ncbi:hypothetical protein ACF1G0_32580 [Streptomyces sp. NPDC013953]|uniref:hypothetical protein n=1 Tax=Streptomyces sp. NPDC013953 TaxID=3364868 RepID=UPI0036F90A57